MDRLQEEMAVVDAASSNDFVERLAGTPAKTDQSDFGRLGGTMMMIRRPPYYASEIWPRAVRDAERRGDRGGRRLRFPGVSNYL